MAQAYSFDCSGGGSPQVATVGIGSSATDVLGCASGQLVQVTVEPDFSVSALNTGDLAGAFGAGFSVMATGLVIAWAARFIVQAIRSVL